MLRRSGLLALLVLSASIHAQVLSSEALLTAGEIGASPEMVHRPRIATNGRGSLVAWDAYSLTRWAKLDERGEITARGAIPAYSYFRDLVATGDGYLILTDTLDDAMLTSVDESGAIRWQSRVPARSTNALAWNGSSALVVGMTGGAYLVDASGHAGAHIGLPAPAGALFYSAAANRDEFDVIVQDQTSIYLDRISAAGAILGTTRIDGAFVLPALYDKPAIATDGSVFFISWRFAGQLLGAIVDGGVVKQTFTIDDRVVEGFPRATWSGSSWLVTYATLTGIVAKRLTRDGVVLDAGQITYSTTDRYPDVDGETYVYERNALCSENESGIYAWSGGRERFLSTGVPAESAPAAVVANGRVFTAYRERGEKGRIRTSLGTIEEPQSIAKFGLATDGSDVLVVTLDGCGAVVAHRFSGTQLVSSTQIASAATAASTPYVMWDGSEYIALWEDGPVSRVMGARISREGALIGSPVPLTPAIERPAMYTTIASQNFTLVPNGGEYLLVWFNYKYSYIPLYPDPPPIIEVKVRHISAALVPLGDARVIANGWSPYAVSNGSEAVIVWTTAGSVLHAGRLTANGDIEGDHVVATPGFNPLTPVVATADGFLVAAGNVVAALDKSGAVQWMTWIASGESAVDSTVVRDGDEVTLLYARHSRIYTRRILLGAVPRKRAVGK